MLLHHLAPFFAIVWKQLERNKEKKSKNSFFAITIIIKKAWAGNSRRQKKDMKLYDYCNFSLLDFAHRERYLLLVGKRYMRSFEESGIKLFSTSCWRYIPLTLGTATKHNMIWLRKSIYLHIQRMFPLHIRRQVKKRKNFIETFCVHPQVNWKKSFAMKRGKYHWIYNSNYAVQ